MNNPTMYNTTMYTRAPRPPPTHTSPTVAPSPPPRPSRFPWLQGLGKTIQTISLLSHLACEQGGSEGLAQEGGGGLLGPAARGCAGCPGPGAARLPACLPAWATLP